MTTHEQAGADGGIIAFRANAELKLLPRLRASANQTWRAARSSGTWRKTNPAMPETRMERPLWRCGGFEGPAAMHVSRSGKGIKSSGDGRPTRPGVSCVGLLSPDFSHFMKRGHSR